MLPAVPVQYSVTNQSGMLMLWQNSSGYGSIINGSAELLCEWDTATDQPGDEYARMMAREVQSSLAGNSGHILLLGGGCGAIAASILCNTDNSSVDAVELSEVVTRLAASHFYPVMESSTDCAGVRDLRTRMRTINADALRLKHLRSELPNRQGYTHVLVDIPPVYYCDGAVGTQYWDDLGTLTVGDGALVVINTWCTASRARELRNELLLAGWSGVQEVLAYDVGLHGERVHNTIVIARDWWPRLSPFRWTRFARLRYHLGSVEMVLGLFYGVLASLLLLRLICAAVADGLSAATGAATRCRGARTAPRGPSRTVEWTAGLSHRGTTGTSRELEPLAGCGSRSCRTTAVRREGENLHVKQPL